MKKIEKPVQNSSIQKSLNEDNNSEIDVDNAKFGEQNWFFCVAHTHVCEGRDKAKTW